MREEVNIPMVEDVLIIETVVDIVRRDIMILIRRENTI